MYRYSSPIRTTLVLTLLFMGLAGSAMPEVIVNARTLSTSVSTSASNDLNFSEDRDGVELDTANPSISSTLNAIAALGGTASATWNGQVSVTEGASIVRAAAEITQDVFTVGDGALGGGRCANADATSRTILGIDFTVQDTPAFLTFNYTGTHTTTGVGGGGCGGSGFAELTRFGLFNQTTGEAIDTGDSGVFCSSRPDLPSVCGSASRSVSLGLPPGDYSVQFSTTATSGRTGSATLSATWSLEISSSECDLTWNEFTGGGLFSDEDNWSPKQVPRDDGGSCNALLIDRTGTFNIGVSDVQRANRLTVRTGSPTLQSSTRGSLRLSNPDLTALSIEQGADLTVDGLFLDANDIAIGSAAGGDGEASLRATGPNTVVASTGVRPDTFGAKVLNLGGNQDAVLEVSNGALVTAGEMNVGFGFTPEVGDGTVRVLGASGTTPSSLGLSGTLTLGDDRTGALTVSGGAALNMTNGAGLRVGKNDDATLTVTGRNPVDNVTSLAAIAGDLQAGGRAGTTSNVFLADGARLTARAVKLGVGGPAVFFANTGARIETVNDIEISGRNSTRMEVVGGSVVAAGTGIVVGEGPGGISILNIDGGNGNTLTEVSGTEVVAGANGGTGEIIVAGFANLRANSFTAPTPEPTANGKLTIEDNASADFANVSLGNTGRGLLEVKRGGILDASISVIVLGRGHLAVAAGGAVISPRVRVIEPGGRVTGTQQRGKQGSEAPGRITGDLELADGAVLELETGDGEGPALVVEGNLLAAGDLELRIAADAALNAGDVLNALEVVGNFTGAFDQVLSPDRTADFAATATFTGGELRVTVQNPGRPLAGEGEGEEEGEGEGEDVTPPPTGCQGCGGDGKSLSWTDQLGSWLIALASASVLGLASLRRQVHPDIVVSD